MGVFITASCTVPEMGTQRLETKNEHYSSLSAPFASLHTRKPKRCEMKGRPPSRLLHFALPPPSPLLLSPTIRLTHGR
ncbi:unnamed protein product [Chondrus crispus]|uniref:Uncharacterized protein n=1 Tax=Chondrus crispus TaxID=2769 RepID=R7QTN7_CHOCR|nr:unnamed protein product [Chondrus crispus]CDF41058.1 unnamed protein product [Chondrus crispus]|eukprot:XP_005711352.1 unnamed protein product [Chondrus crispus]